MFLLTFSWESYIMRDMKRTFVRLIGRVGG
jgi:hypothetical protein